MLLYIELFLEAGFQVALWPDNLNETPIYSRELQRMGVEVIYSPAFVNRFGEWFRARSDVVDYVFLSRPHVADHYLDILREFGARQDPILWARSPLLEDDEGERTSAGQCPRS